MKARFIAVLSALLLAGSLGAPAIAADLHGPHEGTSCPAGHFGTWHFVNVQTGKDAAPGNIIASFDGGGLGGRAGRRQGAEEHAALQCGWRHCTRHCLD